MNEESYDDPEQGNDDSYEDELTEEEYDIMMAKTMMAESADDYEIREVQRRRIRHIWGEDEVAFLGLVMLILPSLW